jgi:hypothetical protein
MVGRRGKSMPNTFPMIRLFDAAIREYGPECKTLRPLAEARYDTVYCNHIADRFPALAPRVYDGRVIGRLDRNGRPMEWNETLWTRCGPLEAAYRSEGPGGKPG